MNRRKFNLLGVSSAGLFAIGGKARAAAGDVSQLTSTLTPFGALRAGNAAGTIPAWSGGLGSMPSGFSATPGNGMLPDFFGSDAKIVSITAANMSQYADKLSAGTQQMLQKYPQFKVDVYPTHRTFVAPQYVYDNTARNAGTAQIVAGNRFGFTNAYGGIPFPFLDADPSVAGCQVMYNHGCRWNGLYYQRTQASHVVDNGRVILTSGYQSHYYNAYYDPNKNYDSWDKDIYDSHTIDIAPPASVGQQNVYDGALNPLSHPSRIWEYLSGQGRVRKAPEIQYDNPQAENNGVMNTDENFVFTGAIDKYDWKYLGKKEIFIPYNCNKLYNCTIDDVFQPQTINADAVRWELHRVHVVDAQLHPGERHTVPKRRFYVDEDTWNAALSDAWDGDGNFWRVGMSFPENRPDVPGTLLSNYVLYNIQSNKYATADSSWNTAPYNGPYDTRPMPPQMFNPQSMAAQDQY